MRGGRPVRGRTERSARASWLGTNHPRPLAPLLQRGCEVAPAAEAALGDQPHGSLGTRPLSVVGDLRELEEISAIIRTTIIVGGDQLHRDQMTDRGNGYELSQHCLLRGG